MRLSEISALLEVSVETIRNWQRLGVIPEEISHDEISGVKSQLVTSGRLSSRANKLYGGEGAHANREGVYYTPQDIVRDMMRSIPREGVEQMLFLDPCCGSGNFLEEALAVGFLPKNIYGFDVDSDAVEIAKKRVVGAHITCGDFLDVAHSLTKRFDYIYTNPPWGKRLDTQSRALYTKRYNTPRSADTTAIFMLAALGVLHEGGRLSFLVQEAVFNVGSFEWLREEILKLRIIELKDYGRAFKGLMTRAQSITLDKREALRGDLCRCCYKESVHSREVASFLKNPKSIMNFWATNEDMATIDKIYSMPHKTLLGAARWGLGIVTGNNALHCSTTKSKEFSVGVITGVDISLKGIAPASIFINGDLTRYQQSAPREVYLSREKLVYKFISNRLCFAVEREQRYTLNSANCIVITKPLGASTEQVAALLNSKIMSWLHQKIFRSHKILRTDVESLPLHVDYFQHHEEFDEMSFCEYLTI